MIKTLAAMLKEDRNNKVNENYLVNGHSTWRRLCWLQTIYIIKYYYRCHKLMKILIKNRTQLLISLAISGFFKLSSANAEYTITYACNVTRNLATALDHKDWDH